MRTELKLRNGLFSPMPGGVFAGYSGDTGLDIAGDHLNIYAVASGTLDYSEHGHTMWVNPPDTGNSIRLRLDNPMTYNGRFITHIWMTHLSKLQYQVSNGNPRVHVNGGDLLGVSGLGNKNPHLHIGFLLDNDVSQNNPHNYLSEDEIRKLMGNYNNGEKLPTGNTNTEPSKYPMSGIIVLPDGKEIQSNLIEGHNYIAVQELTLLGFKVNFKDGKVWVTK